jgi:hypothetical protein
MHTNKFLQNLFMFKSLCWMFKGCPLYIGVITTGAVTAAGVAAAAATAASVAGTVMSASASKDANGKAVVASVGGQQDAMAAILKQFGLSKDEITQAVQSVTQQQSTALNTVQSNNQGYTQAGQQVLGGLTNTMGGIQAQAPTRQTFNVQAPTQAQNTGQMGGTYKGITIPQGVSAAAFQQVVDQADQAHQQQYGVSIFSPQSGYESGQYGDLKTQLNNQWTQQAQALTTQQQAASNNTYQTQLADYNKQQAAWNDPTAAAARDQQFTDQTTAYNQQVAAQKADPSFGAATKPLADFKTYDKAAPTYTQFGQAVPQYQKFGEALPQYQKYDQALPQFKAYDQALPQYQKYNQPIPVYTKTTIADMKNDPGYQFRLEQGTSAIQNSAAIKGTALSGNTMKSLGEYGQNFASNEFGAVDARNNTSFNNNLNQWNTGNNANTNDFTQNLNQWNTGNTANTNNFNNSLNQWNTGNTANSNNFINSLNQWTTGNNANTNDFTQSTNAWNTGNNQNTATYQNNLADWGVGYAKNSADQSAQQAIDIQNRDNAYNKFQGLTSLGQTATTQNNQAALTTAALTSAGTTTLAHTLANSRQNTGNNLAQLYTGIGKAHATGAINNGNVNSGMITGVANSLGTLASTYSGSGTSTNSGSNSGANANLNNTTSNALSGWGSNMYPSSSSSIYS